jgi:hypothetical protein
MKMKIVLLVVAAVLLGGCAADAIGDAERAQQQKGNLSIVDNQPVPDLGGYSFERQILIDTYIARNNTVATYSYMITMDGQIIEICPSIGYPIPYSTQLSSPMRKITGYELLVPNAEPNSLYPPADAAATLVQCANPDGSVSPTYNEWYVLAFPYRIKSDRVLERISEPTWRLPIEKP